MNKDVRYTLSWLSSTKTLPEEAICWLRERTADPKAFRDEVRWLLTDVQWAELMGELRCARAEQRAKKAESATRAVKDQLRVAKAHIESMRRDVEFERELRNNIIDAYTAPRQQQSIPQDMAKVIRMLVHPDRHNGSQASVKAFKYINEVVKR